MAYFVLVGVGLAALLLVKKGWPEKWQFAFVGIMIAAAAFGYVLVDVFIFGEDDIISKGPGEILAEIPWLDLGMYFVMLLGMVSKYLFDAIGDKNRKKIKFNKWQFIKPFLVSPIIFAAVYGMIPEATSALMVFVFAYQNGFFWQTLLYKYQPSV